MTENIGLLMLAAEAIARTAGDVALRHFRSGLAVERKADGSEVTAADREAELAARAWIERSFPADGIMGEEHGVTRRDARRRWLIDPIDGTRSYVRGVPLWGTLVALAEGDEVHVGAAYFPVVGEMLVAGAGEGCWWNGARCAVSPVSEVSGATVLATDERFLMAPGRRAAWRALADGAAVSRSWGDCYGYLLVATGRAEVMVDPILSPWDSAVLLPLIEEAGGVFTDWDGTRTPFGGSAIATNRALAAPVRDILQERAAEPTPPRR
ncbi:MAG TPA: histidinol-phosphatase [Gemmatimonadaceae bacterium]|nr:histidinol-phosphatase [Gemmatimonadaceae bacterium]